MFIQHIVNQEYEYSEHIREIKYTFMLHIVIVFSFLLLLIHHTVTAKTVEERLMSILALIILILISKETIYDTWDMLYDET